MIDDAIAVLEAEVALFHIGTDAAPKEGTPEFFLCRAKYAGLSMLKQLRSVGIDDPRRIENFYRATSKALKAAVSE